MEIKEIDKELNIIVEAIKQNIKLIDVNDSFIDLIQHNEIKIALENLCDIIYEYDLKLNSDIINRIIKVSMYYKIEQKYLKLLK